MKSQSGSAIIMLFVAVALFGALAFAFTQGSRTSTTFLTDEQAKSYAQQIIAYGNEIRGAIKRIQLRGYKDTEIGFDNTTFGNLPGPSYHNPPNHNPNCNVDGCKVFSIQGGGITPVIMEGAKTNIDGSPVTGIGGTGGHVRLVSFKIEGVGTSEPELIVQVLDMTEQICKKINSLLGLDFSGSSIPPSDSFSNIIYNGVFSAAADPVGDVATGLVGKTSFCFLGNGSNSYHYNIVAIAR
jgi:hypothetical protein